LISVYLKQMLSTFATDEQFNRQAATFTAFNSVLIKAKTNFNSTAKEN